jgi:hypothetical protein
MVMSGQRGGVFGIGLVCLVVALAPAGTARASDPPHWMSASIPEASISCSKGCHQLHQASGGTLTAWAGNVVLCQSCHGGAGLASALAIANTDSAVPDVSGSSHAFGAPAVNAAYGAAMPSNPEMQLRIMNNNVVCSTCHDQHAATLATGGTPRISPAKKITALGSTGVVTSGGTFSGSTGFWYLVEIQAGGALATARFRWSKDNGISWMGSNLLTAATATALDSGVTVAFGAGNYVVGERWELSGSYPFLRAALDSGDNATGARFCRDCHSAWAQDHTATHTWDGTLKSHPVGVAQNANGGGYDRAVPLDANGVSQGGAGDGNRTNDLRLDTGGRVQCLSCHSPHFAPGNSSAVMP